MNTHILKSWPEQFQALKSGEKNHEYRRNDRDFKVGDHIILQEWIPETEIYTGDCVAGVITFITYGPDFEIPEGFCVMSVRVNHGEAQEGEA